MAKISCHYFGLGIAAEGEENFLERIADKMLSHVNEDNMRMDEVEVMCNPDIPRPITETVHTPGADYDVVAIYDNAGIPSIMHRFRRVSNKDLFGGEDKPHPAFVIGGEAVDEIYISVYQNTMINGKPYSLPRMKPATDITMEDFAQACFSKGEGWHCLTAAEWGLLANTSLKLGTLPHGNTNYGKWHGDESEAGESASCGGMTLTGTGPATWTHDHTATGVHDLCGNIWEFCRGMRIVNGALQAAENNDAAMPETDLSENGTGWKPIVDNEGKAIRVSVVNDKIRFTTEEEIGHDYTGNRWGEVAMECKSDELKALAFFAGEKDPYCFVDSTEGEYILFRGGSWNSGSYAGLFYSDLADHRSFAGGSVGGRSAFYKKHCTLIPDPLPAE